MRAEGGGGASRTDGGECWRGAEILPRNQYENMLKRVNDSVFLQMGDWDKAAREDMLNNYTIYQYISFGIIIGRRENLKVTKEMRCRIGSKR